MTTLNACLHLHVKGDPHEDIKHTAEEVILKAKSLGIQVIAITCHEKVVYSDKIAQFGKKNGITVIPGIEATVEKKHVLILNADEDANSVNTFVKLASYKKSHPNCFILAPHPYYLVTSCLMGKLEKYIDLFDGIEWNYFYSNIINPNLKAMEMAKKYNKPLIGTSDVHDLKYLNPTYTAIECENTEILSIINAMKQNKVKLITKKFSSLKLFHLLWVVYKATH